MKTFLTLFLVAGSALANDADLLRCRAMGDAAQRLACYDAIPAGVRAPVAAAPAAVAPPVAAAAPAAAPAQSMFAKAAAAIGFGSDNLKKPDAEVVDVIESHIPGNFAGWRPNLNMTLANGQVWRVMDDSEAIIDETNPKVLIRRGAFGVYYMEFEHTNRSPRVRRIK